MKMHTIQLQSFVVKYLCDLFIFVIHQYWKCQALDFRVLAIITNFTLILFDHRMLELQLFALNITHKRYIQVNKSTNAKEFLLELYAKRTL